MVVFVCAYALAYFSRVGWIFSSNFPFTPYVTVVIAVAPIWLLVLLTTRTFALTRNQCTLRNIAYIAYSCVVGVSLFAIGYYFSYGLFFSRLLLVYALVNSVVMVWCWHLLFDKLQRHVLRSDPPAFPALIVGVNRESTALIKHLNERRNPLKPVAILDGRGSKEKEIDGVPVLGKLNKLEDTLETYGITHLIQCSDLEQSLNLLGACRKRSITYVLLPSVLGIVEGDERIDTLEGLPVTMVSPKNGPLSWFVR